MHEEFLSTEKSEKGKAKVKALNSNDTDSGDEWKQVGRKNKTSIILTKENEFKASPISQIFGGQLRSSVKRQGGKASDTIQPFYCLHLDIEVPQVRSLDDALSLFMSPELLEGYTCSKNNIEVQASKRMTLERLPSVLVVHFKRFSYTEDHALKIEKHVLFPVHLDIKNAFLSHDLPIESRAYSLFAIVSHHGQHLAKGHYTCDIYSPKDSEWLHFDDGHVSRVSPKVVQTRQAYLLMYQTCQEVK